MVDGLGRRPSGRREYTKAKFQCWDDRSFMALHVNVCILHQNPKSLNLKRVNNRLDCWIIVIKHPDSVMKRLFDTVVNFVKREWFLFVAIFAIVIIIAVLELL